MQQVLTVENVISRVRMNYMWSELIKLGQLEYVVVVILKELYIVVIIELINVD